MSVGVVGVTHHAVATGYTAMGFCAFFLVASLVARLFVPGDSLLDQDTRVGLFSVAVFFFVVLLVLILFGVYYGWFW